MIEKRVLNVLANSKNLLAFSAGVDSTALFFILQELGIDFDIAIVNYGLREEAKEEVDYAKELANSYGKKIFIANAPKFSSNFEKEARDFRYGFFKDIIKQERYDNLLTAHQLNDKLEWLLMRLGKGGGVNELAGMKAIDKRDGYSLLRPLLTTTKEQLQKYLDNKGVKYYIDSSNFNKKYERNRFRDMVNQLLQNKKDGFVKSFEILEKESEILNRSYKLIYKNRSFLQIEIRNKELIDSAASKYLKELGYLISGKERLELKKSGSIVAGRVWAVEFTEPYLYIAPYIKTVMKKEFKELCRVKKIPPKIRGYIYSEKIPLQGSF